MVLSDVPALGPAFGAIKQTSHFPGLILRDPNPARRTIYKRLFRLGINGRSFAHLPANVPERSCESDDTGDRLPMPIRRPAEQNEDHREDK